VRLRQGGVQTSTQKLDVMALARVRTDRVFNSRFSPLDD